MKKRKAGENVGLGWVWVGFDWVGLGWFGLVWSGLGLSQYALAVLIDFTHGLYRTYSPR